MMNPGAIQMWAVFLLGLLAGWAMAFAAYVVWLK